MKPMSPLNIWSSKPLSTRTQSSTDLTASLLDSEETDTGQNSSLGDRVDLDTPLFASSPPSSPPSSVSSRQPPLHAFRHSSQSHRREEEKDDMEITLRIFGAPYAQKKRFWLVNLPLALVLGIFIGFSSLFFLFSYRFLFFRLFGLDNEALGNVGPWSGKWYWMIITTMGGFLSGLILLFPSAPKLGLARSMFREAVDLEGNYNEAPFVIMACFTALSCGFSIGPEMALGCLGSAAASFLGNAFHLKVRSKVALVLCGLASALGGLFPSPVLGVLMAHELSVVARPEDIRLDAIAEQKSVKSTSHPKINHHKKDHDFMEQVSLTGSATVAAFAVFHSFMPNPERIDLSQYDDQFQMWHLAVAAGLGVVCGLIGTGFLIANGIGRLLRLWLGKLLKMCGAPSWIGLLFVPTFIGMIHGLISVAYPLTLGSGTELFHATIQQGFNNTNPDGIQNGDELILPKTLLISAALNVLITGLSLGSGIVGGQLFPNIYTGILLGLAIPFYIPSLPTSLTLPCCMAAITGSFVPMPLTLVTFTIIVTSMTARMGAPVFVSVIVAYCTNGGLGVISLAASLLLGKGKGNKTTAERKPSAIPEEHIFYDQQEVEDNSQSSQTSTDDPSETNQSTRVRDMGSIVFGG